MVSKEERIQLAQEVLELGEELFELTLSGQEAAKNNSGENSETKAYPVEELRAAKEEFFVALRVLLDGKPDNTTM